MGSTIEASIVFTLVFMIIMFMILEPMYLCADTVGKADSANEEIKYYIEAGDIIDSMTIGDRDCHSTNPEILCTFLTGISENYRIVYGTVIEVSDESN